MQGGAGRNPLKEQFAGAWTLVSWEQTNPDGSKLRQFGDSPKGLAFFDPAGHYMISVMCSDRANYDIDNFGQVARISAEEAKDGPSATRRAGRRPVEASAMILPDGYSDVPAGKIATVVTHLQMTARPTMSPAPSGPWMLRHVERPDLAWYRDLYRRVGEEYLWFSRIRAADEKLAARLHHPLVETHALVADGRDEGLLEFDFREVETCEIGMFGVTAKLFGTGAGRFLMHRALELAWSRPIKRLWLHTCTYDHPAALPFYQRAGFRPFRRQVEIEDDPRLDGTAPRDVAKHVPVIE